LGTSESRGCSATVRDPRVDDAGRAQRDRGHPRLPPLAEAVEPRGRAWFIINHDLKGLQARSHHLVEKMSPFARNNNWWEIVTAHGAAAAHPVLSGHPRRRRRAAHLRARLQRGHRSLAQGARLVQLQDVTSRNRCLLESLSYVLPNEVANFLLLACVSRDAQGPRYAARTACHARWPG
jgi:hypothetical protein